jgi:hypothetical protein
MNAVEFVAETRLDPTGIRKAGQYAMEAGKRFMNTTITEAVAGDHSISYLAKGPGGLRKQMAIEVSWKELAMGATACASPSATT